MSLEGTGRPSGLADRLDELLYRLEGLRARPWVLLFGLASVAAGVALTVQVRSSAEAPPLDELLPMAEGATPATTPDAVEAVAPASDVATGQNSSGAVLTEVDALESAADEQAPDLVVHVVGAVRRPGVVTVPASSRIADVVAAAGGVADGADVQRLNLAAPAGDGMQVRVPHIDDGDEVDALPLIVHPSSVQTAASADGAGAAGPVNVNTADQALLETLPGIGPATATAIITWRDDNGPFIRNEDLLDVPGIGPAKMAALNDHVTT